MLKRLEITSSEADRKLSASLLKHITSSRSLDDGRELHRLLARVGRDRDTFLGNLLVDMYSKCGRIDEAYEAFDHILRRNVFSWNAILAANCHSRQHLAAETVLRKMPNWDSSSWTMLLALHGDRGDLAELERLLDQMPEVNAVALTILLNANARSGYMRISVETFEHMHSRDIATYNAMLAAYAGCHEHEKLWRLFGKMTSWDLVSFNTALAAFRHLDSAKRFFESMPQRDVFSWNSMLQMYISANKSDSCKLTFHRMPNHSLVSWNSIIQTNIQHCQYDRALALLEEVPELDVLTCNFAIQIYSEFGWIGIAREAFDSMERRDIVTWATMLVAYTRNGDFPQANSMLENMPMHNAVAHTAILVSYTNIEDFDGAIKTFSNMPELDVIAWNAMLVAYAMLGQFAEAEQFYSKMPMHDTCSWNTLLQAYIRYGDIGNARKTFDSMLQRDLISWNAMLAADSQAGHPGRALFLFASMDLEGVKADTTTFSIVLNACAETGALTLGRLIRASLEETPDLENIDNVAVWTALLNMYGKCGRLDEARLQNNNNLDQNTILLAYSRNGHHEEALRLFKTMDLDGIRPDDRCHLAAIDACASLTDLDLGKAIYGSLIEIATVDQALIINTALLNLYGSCGEIVSARGIFDALPDKDTISWNSIIAQTGSRDPEAAIQLFREMDLQGFNPDEVTLAAVLDISTAASIDLHIDEDAAAAVRRLGSDRLSTSLLTMYGRRGRLRDAVAAFDTSLARDPASWNAMLSAYSQSFPAVVHCFATMQLHGVPPTSVTFVTLLAACSHAGELDCGATYLADMTAAYGVVPNTSHYVCIADLLSRLGQLDSAAGVVRGMPYEPDPVAWTSILGACGSHGCVERARDAARYAVDVDPLGSSSYVLLSNALGTV